MLDLSWTTYFHETANAISLTDLFGGVFKASVYGVLIALSGCLRGLQCGNSSSAVGDAATSAVVTGSSPSSSPVGSSPLSSTSWGSEWSQESNRNGASPHITVRDLTMAFGSFVLMRDLNFTVNHGDVFIIMGGSGSGKSTLLRHLIGLIEPAKGEYLLRR